MFGQPSRIRPVQFTVLATLVIMVFWLSLTGCEKTTNIVEPSPQNYVGSRGCQACHPDVYAEFSTTGHNFILNSASSASQQGYYPFDERINPPPSRGWGDIFYVVGGFWWKANFVDKQGYLITGDQAQFNLVSDKWVAFGSGTLPYDCGPCHTTGYRPEGHQNGLVGVTGTWALNGVQCERCHGPGSKHVAAPYDNRMVIDRSSSLCGECHVNGDVARIPAADGFIQDHAQFNELHATKKITFACVDCHDPHVSLNQANLMRANAIKAKCETCHYQEAAAFAASSLPHYRLGIKCIECHMPHVAKSADSVPARHRADVRTHLFRINTSTSAIMFTSDGKYSNGYLTLDYVCLGCHVAEDISWARSNAPAVHPL